MKKLLIGLVLISICVQTHRIYAQKTLISEVNVSELKLPEYNKVSSKPLNSNYLNVISHYNKAIHVADMENKVSRFNIKNTDEFNGKDQPFKVKFKSESGNILVAYDKGGEILYTVENFKNVKLPKLVRTTVFKAYPKWGLVSTSYHVEYNKNKSMIEFYKVKISNGETKKNLKLNSKGQLL